MNSAMSVLAMLTPGAAIAIALLVAVLVMLRRRT
jgi:Na+-translocating ferredoxin:NAD+ oxidoreductase RnfE subunit